MTKATKWFSTMAVDQYGRRYDDLGKHPRKALLERLGRKSAARMYCDKKSGGATHTGWVIGGLWLRVYRVEEFG